MHGDLHHENILRHGEEQWAVIDPKCGVWRGACLRRAGRSKTEERIGTEA
nr:aminoglycoside phosphotransferase family protein [Paenibacillus dokdonensis]